MKKLIKASVTVFTIIFVVFVFSCKKQEVYRVIKISTDTIANISDTSALVFGTIIDTGDGITQYGHCWSTNENPTIDDNVVNNGSTSETGQYTSTLRGLVAGTIYYIKAYASNGNETIYGEEKFFSSGKGLPKLSILEITNISKASASCKVNIISDGSETILTKGIVWGINSNPVLGYSDGYVTEESDTNIFRSQITNVSPESTVYVRGYASNENGIAYSEQHEITMLSPESGDYIWAYNYGNNNVDYGDHIWVDPSGDIFVAGTFKSTSISFGEHKLSNTGDNDIYIAKFNSDGEVLWAKSAEGPGNDRLSGFCGDAAGNVYLSGSSGDITFETINLTSTISFVAKYDGSGNVQWAKKYANSIASIACDAAGNFFITGLGDVAFLSAKKSYRTKAVGFTSAYVAKFDTDGNYSWGNNIGDLIIGDGIELFEDICVDQSGNVYASGTYNMDILVNGVDMLTNAGVNDIYIVKYSNSGTYIWARNGSGTSTDNIGNISSDANGNVYLTGNFLSASLTFSSLAPIINAGGSDLFIAKYNSAGTAQWAKSYGGPANDYGAGISTDASGNVYLGGSFSSNEVIFGNDTLTSMGESDILITKFTEAGNVDWAQSAGSFLHDECRSVVTNGNYVYLTGKVEGPVIYFDYFELPYLGLDDVFVSKIRQ